SAGPTTQLPCKPSKEFQLTIPEDGGQDIVRDANGSKDPVYKTSQGDWTIMEVSKASNFQIIKINLFYDDSDEMIVCWALKRSGKNIIANINPLNPTQCPPRYIPIYETCTLSRATLIGTCISGACNGTSTKSSTASVK
ncbi:hypothetical protein L0F63_006429, partial [Massospora cicadina]